MNFDLNQTPPLLVSAVIVLLMKAVKESPIPNWIIPYIAYATGAVAYPLLVGWSPEHIFNGIVIGAAATGLHQGFAQVKQPEPKEPSK